MSAERVQSLGEFLVRYALVLIVVWFGLMKFTAYEAEAIRPLVAPSPLLGWTYRFLSAQALSNVLGVGELAIATMIALRPLAPALAAVGSGLAVAMFLTTLSLLVTTPGAWEPSLGGFPAPGPAAGCLLKDLVLLGAAVWSLGESLTRLREPHLATAARP